MDHRLELKSLAFQVEQMRNCQKNYFKLIAQAKKTKLPADFAAAANMLKLSKQHETLVDDTIMKYRSETEFKPEQF